MSSNLQNKLWIVSRNTLLILVTQCVSCVVLMAHKSTGQSLDNTYVSVEWKSVSLVEGLRDLEGQTEFAFLYKDKEIKQISRVTLAANNTSLRDVLTLLSKENDLVFKRLNSVISVIRKENTRAENAGVYEDQTITGKVTSESGEAIPGVTVQVKGTSIGGITDFDGIYTIDAPDDATILVFSSVGFAQKEVNIRSRSIIDVTMTTDMTELQEVVVVGYGTTSKRELAGSISSVDFSPVENTPIQSFDKVLQGRTPGVQIVNGGAPGGATQVRIRGIGSINSGNQPLFIVDGVQVVQGAYGEAGGGQENVLASINPNDIVSVEVLKDASASIYGAQAANGVVIITTKRGRTGETEFGFNAHWGINQVINRLDMLTGPEWTELVLEGYANRYGAESQQYQDQLAFLGNPADAPDYDWQDLLFQNGLVQNYQLSARGGNEVSKFYISGNYNSTEGHVIGTGFQRGTLRINLDNNLTDKLKSTLSTNLSMTNTDATRGDGFWFNNPTIASAFIVPTNAPYEADGSIREPLFGLYTENPLVNQDENLYDETTTNYKALTNLVLDYEIIDGLHFKSSWGIDFLVNNYRYYGSPDAQVAASTNGTVYESFNRSFNWQTDQTLNFSNTFNRHKVDALVGVNYRQQKLKYFYADGENLSSTKLDALSTASTPTVGGSNSEWRLAGLFGRVNYIFDEKYIFTGTIRRDGSSRFGSNNRWGTFPAAAVAWRIGNEPFMAPIASIINDLKFRASYGITGNANISNFAARGFFSAASSFLGNGALIPSSISNPDLSWERSETYNFGVDASLNNFRITVTADYFIRNTNDLLLNRPVPATSGYTSVLQNIGEVQNKGVEFEINSVNVDAGDFRWSTGFNITTVQNEVLSLTGETDQVIGGSTITKVGEPIDSWFVIRYAGVNPADGRPMYYDNEDNLTFNPTNDDRVIVASSLPTYYGGLTNDISYKGLSLSVLFQYSGGNYLRNQLAFSTKASGGFADRNQQRSELDRWQQPGDITDVPIAWNGFTYNATPGNNTSSRHIEKGDFIRLKQVNLSYSLPLLLVEKMNMKSITIYASANNIWTATQYSGRDPEILGGDETGDYPQPKSYVVGINVGF